MALTKTFLYNILSQHKLAVISTVSDINIPESAVVGIAVSLNLEIIFDTLISSRKYANLVHNPSIAMVCWEGEMTVQYEGKAEMVNPGHDGDSYRELYYATYPDGRERAKQPGLMHLFCRIKRFIKELFGSPVIYSRYTASVNYDNPECTILRELYKKYNLRNPGRLGYAMNRRLMDSLHVSTLTQLQDTIKKIQGKKIETAFANQTATFEDTKYYVYGNVRGGWANVDAFMKIPPEQLTRMEIKLGGNQNMDCKIVFKERNLIISSECCRGNFIFTGIPKGENVWVVAMKYDNKKPYFCIKEMTTERGSYTLEMRPSTLAELKEKLKALDI